MALPPAETHKVADALDWGTVAALVTAPFWTDPLDYSLRTITLLIGIAVGLQQLLRNRRRRK